MERFEKDFDSFSEAWVEMTVRYQCIKIKTKQIPAFFKKLPIGMRLKMQIPDGARDAVIDRIVL